MNDAWPFRLPLKGGGGVCEPTSKIGGFITVLIVLLLIDGGR